MTGGGDGRALDVFVSCAEDGLGWAEWITTTLVDAGYRVRFGAWDAVPGTHRVSWLDGVIRQARQTIAVASDGYLASPTAPAEWGAAWSPRVLDGERRLLVARVTDRPIPGLLGQLAPIDLAGRGELAARAALFSALLGEPRRPETARDGGTFASGARPETAGRERAGGTVFPGELPAVWNVPRPAAPFVGRTGALTRLGDAMGSAPLVAVTGLAGIGKTSLAVEYVRARRADFDAVWWVPAGRPELVGERVRGLAPALGLPAHAEPAAVLARLDAADGRWLLVLDDAAGPAELPGWLRPSSGAGRVLVTSRADDWTGLGAAWRAGLDGDGAPATVVPLGPMERAESVALLVNRLPAVDRTAAGRIAAQLGDHPLALDQAAHRIDRARAPAETYLAALVERPLVVLGQGEVPGRPGVTAATLWTEPIRRLAADAPAAGELLRLAAHGDSTVPLPLRLLTADPDAIPTAELRAAARDPFDLADTVAEVERAGLAHRDGSALGMHVLVRSAVRADTSPEHADQLVDALGRLLHTALPERITATPDAWPAWRELLPHALATLDATPPDADTPHTAWLAEHAAAYLTEHGHAATAEPLAARAATAHERLHGPDHPTTLAARETVVISRAECGERWMVTRSFGTAGPCVPGRHFMIPASERLPEVPVLVARENYFVLHAPRQTGKTTALQALAADLTAGGRYAAIVLSMEAGRPWPDDVGAASRAILGRARRTARTNLPADLRPPPWPDSWDEVLLSDAFAAWAEACPKPLVLFLDEIDALSGRTLLSILGQLRDGYRDRPSGFPSSIALCGLRDVREYKVASGGDPTRLTSPSPFNITVTSLRLNDFTLDEVRALYGQHTTDTGHGWPWPVSRTVILRRVSSRSCRVVPSGARLLGASVRGAASNGQSGFQVGECLVDEGGQVRVRVVGQGGQRGEHGADGAAGDGAHGESVFRAPGALCDGVREQERGLGDLVEHGGAQGGLGDDERCAFLYRLSLVGGEGVELVADRGPYRLDR